MNNQSKMNRVTLVTAIGILIGVLLLVLWRLSPSDVVAFDEQPERFSAERARDIIKRINPDGRPHPLGSRENDRVRERIVSEFNRIGLQAQIEEAPLFRGDGEFARLKNIVARIPGKSSDGICMLMAHYDTVPAAPGASDDDAGVAAILEIARIIKAGPQPIHSIVFLITDGEEYGMLGAQVFVRDNQQMIERIVAVLNFEARGTSGPSLMFQTGPESARLVNAFIRNSPRPIITSIFPTMYEMLPNDTDLSIFIKAGVPGLNFAYINNSARYHTRNDSLDYLNLASLQHQGGNVLGVIREVMNQETSDVKKGKQVYFDLAGFIVIKWPQSWTPVLATLSLLLIILCGFLLIRRKLLSINSLIWAILCFPLMVTASVVGGYLLVWLIQIFSADSAPWTAHPFPAIAATWLFSLIAALSIFFLFQKKSRFWGTFTGFWLWQSALGLVVSLLQPGFAYLFIFPALCAGLVVFFVLLIGRAGHPTIPGYSLLIPAIVTALVHLSTALTGTQAMGLGMSPLITVPLVLVLAGVSPLIAGGRSRSQRISLLGAGMVTVALLVLALLLPPYSSHSARPLNIYYHLDANSGESRWLISSDKSGIEPFVSAGLVGAGRDATVEFYGPNRLFYSGPAPSVSALPPQISILEDSALGSGRRLTLKLESARGAHAAAILFPSGSHPQSATIAGHELKGISGNRNGWKRINILTMPEGGVEISVTLPHSDPFDLYAVDWSFQLPPECQKIIEARPEYFTPQQSGDYWFITRKVRIEQTE